jgi:hypothetical protein
MPDLVDTGRLRLRATFILRIPVILLPARQTDGLRQVSSREVISHLSNLRATRAALATDPLQSSIRPTVRRLSTLTILSILLPIRTTTVSRHHKELLQTGIRTMDALRCPANTALSMPSNNLVDRRWPKLLHANAHRSPASIAASERFVAAGTRVLQEASARTALA